MYGRTFRRTLERIVETATGQARPDERVEAWCFEGEAARRRAEVEIFADLVG